MNQFDSNKDYYAIIGATEETDRRDLEKLYKRRAAELHPDRGGSEEGMKSLNEAYWVLKDETMRRDYDLKRRKPAPVVRNRASAPAAQDIGLFGHFLSAFLCLLLGLFLLMLVRFQWIWFLWPLVILALFVILFGVLMTHSAMISVSESLPARHPIRRYRKAQEAMFWLAVVVAGYGVYLLLTNVG
jgi:hypothetical protein